MGSRAPSVSSIAYTGAWVSYRLLAARDSVQTWSGVVTEGSRFDQAPELKNQSWVQYYFDDFDTVEVVDKAMAAVLQYVIYASTAKGSLPTLEHAGG
eukprot:3867006-Amphidinium_carterae.1